MADKREEKTKEVKHVVVKPPLNELYRAFELLVRARDAVPLGLRQEIEAFLKGRQRP